MGCTQKPLGCINYGCGIYPRTLIVVEECPDGSGRQFAYGCCD